MATSEATDTVSDVRNQPDDVGSIHMPCVVSFRMRCGHSYGISTHDPDDPYLPFTTKNVGSTIHCVHCDAERLIVRATFYLVDEYGNKRTS